MPRMARAKQAGHGVSYISEHAGTGMALAQLLRTLWAWMLQRGLQSGLHEPRMHATRPVSYTHLRAHETSAHL
eukprot:5423385-Alexandrium_andersonii.AAC.1